MEDCVNSVGVDLNTASAPLLRRVAGITAATAKNIVARRESEGPFASRSELKKVKGLGPKAFEQCAGFLRIPDAGNKLDETAVHPESYAAAKTLLQLCGYKAADIGTAALADLGRPRCPPWSGQALCGDRRRGTHAERHHRRAEKARAGCARQSAQAIAAQ